MGDFEEAILEAVDTLRTTTGKEARALFRDRYLDEPGVLSTPDSQRAAGIIEGAAITLGLTANELFDHFGFPHFGFPDDEEDPG